MSPPPSASLASAPADPPDDERWFREEVQIHERGLRAFLRTRFSKLGDLEDLIQECYAKLLRARRTTTILHPKAFLYTTARHTALNHIRHARVIRIDHEDVDHLSAPDGPQAILDGIPLEKEDALLNEAIASLAPRCREVLILRKFHGLSRPEIAARLGISANTVNAHMSAAIIRCRKFFIARGFIREDEP